MSKTAHTPFTRWLVTTYSDRPSAREYTGETEHYYIRQDSRGKLRRDAKVCSYHQIFETEALALDHIQARIERDAESNRRKLWQAAAIAGCEGIPNPEAVGEAIEALQLLESLCSWLLHRFGPSSPEGKEANFRMAKARAILAKLEGGEA